MHDSLKSHEYCYENTGALAFTKPTFNMPMAPASCGRPVWTGTAPGPGYGQQQQQPLVKIVVVE